MRLEILGNNNKTKRTKAILVIAWESLSINAVPEIGMWRFKYYLMFIFYYVYESILIVFFFAKCTDNTQI